MSVSSQTNEAPRLDSRRPLAPDLESEITSGFESVGKETPRTKQQIRHVSHLRIEAQDVEALERGQKVSFQKNSFFV